MFRIFTLFILFSTIVIDLLGQRFHFLDLPLKDICYSQVNDKLYGVLPGNSAQGNAFVIINPNTGAIEKRVEVGSEPSHIIISNSGRTLYIALFGAPYLQRFDLSTNQFLPVTNLEVAEPNSHLPLNTLDMVLLPNSETSVVVSRMYRGQRPRNYDLAVFDNTQLRDQKQNFLSHGNKLVMMEDGQTLWGLGHDYFLNSIKRYRIAAQGLEEVETYPNLINLEATHVAYQNGRIYLQNGQIFDVSGSGAPQLLTTLDIGQNYNKISAPQVPALDSNYIYFTSDLHRDGVANRFGGSFLKRVDKTTFQRVDSVAIPAPGWLWNGESTKKIISLGKGRIALLSEFYGHARLMLYNSSPCTTPQLNLQITQNSDLSVCFGDSIELSATPGFTDYYWSNGVNGQKIKFSSNWVGKDTIRYRVIGPNGCLSEPSAPAIISVSVKPSELQLFTDINRDALCPDEKGELRALADRAAYSFVWSTGDTLLVGQNLKIDSGGIYTVWARGLYGCLSEPKSIEILEANPGARVKPVITKNGPLTYCNNKLSEFRGPDNAFAYEWSNGASTQSIKPISSGEYALRLRYANGCIGPWSDTLRIKVGYQSPDQLRLYQQSDQLRIENSFFIADSIQWFFNDTLVLNPNRNYYFPQKKGFYSVVSYWQGCPSEPTIPYLYPAAIQAKILSVSNNEQLTSYLLFPNINPIDNYRYKWSNGSTNASLEIKAPGVYCVTVYRDWAQDSAKACITFESLGDLQIEAIDNIPLPGFPIVLYRYLNPDFRVIDTIYSDEKGRALFENLENGTYYVLALPTAGTLLAKQYLPTYARSAILWRDANPFQMRGFHPSDGFPERQYIFLERTQMLMGEGRITGFVGAADGFAPTVSQGFDGTDAQNVGLANVSIVLYDSTGKIVAITYSDTNGNYVFENVPFGGYTVVINYLGVAPFSQVVSITTDEPQANKISFLLKNGKFVVVRAKDIPTLDPVVWPNPLSGNFYYTIPEKCQLFIYDVMGRLLAQRSYSEGVKEENALISQPTGVYWLKIQTESGKIGIKRLIKQ